VTAPFAAFLSPGRSLQRASARASLAETLGYELVLTNHVANRDGLVTLAAYAGTTTRVRLATGVYPAFAMSPLALGQQAASLDEVIGGRLTLGIGTSHRRVIEGWHRRPFPESPVTAMRETLTILRSLFQRGAAEMDGTEVAIGPFAFHGFEPRPDLRIHIAGLGPAMCRLAGELADGLVLWLCEPDYIERTVIPAVREGAESAGRDPAEIEIVAAITTALAGDPGPATARFRRSLIPYLSLPFYRRMFERAGFEDELARFDRGMEADDVDAALEGISDEMTASLSAIGDGTEITRVLDRYRRAGVTHPAVGPLSAEGTASPEQTLAAAIGRTVA
jgi:alkanesulfonate monooxygenase SsuD/methylene tetrahydromethanopterin reductase-like flavin-dependent oxidoreductase (luciferase family)